MNWKTFFICGLTGWCMEILFTSLGGLLRGDLLLNGLICSISYQIFLNCVSPICHLSSLLGLILN